MASRPFPHVVADAALVSAPSDFGFEYRSTLRDDFADIYDEKLRSRGRIAAAVALAHCALDVVIAGACERAAILASDVIFALRSLRKAPLFTFVVVATLAIAIGANAAVFSVLRAVVLAPLPYPHGERIVQLFSTYRGHSKWPFSLPDLDDFARGNHSLSAVTASKFTGATMTAPGSPRRLGGALVQARFFDVFETRPEFGRFFVAADARAGGAPAIVISDSLWHLAFAGSERAIGALIYLDGRQCRIVGVAPATFRQPGNADLRTLDFWEIIPPSAGAANRDDHEYRAYGRLRDGATVTSASADFGRLARALAERFEGDVGRGVLVMSLADQLFGDIARILTVTLAIVIGVLLIACANVANLLLSRSAARSGEIAIRFALGASRRRIVAQILTEVTLLATLGGILGLALARIVIAAFVAAKTAGVPRVETIDVDSGVVAYTLGIAIVCALVAGIAPALAISNPTVASSIKRTGRADDRGGGKRVRSLLVVAEVALAFALVVSSGLVVRSFIALVTVPTAIDTHGVTIAHIGGLVGSRFAKPGAVRNFYARTVREIEALPGVAAAAWLLVVPFSDSTDRVGVDIEGVTRGKNDAISTDFTAVGSDYFTALRIALERGRTFVESDVTSAAPVAIVNERFARTYFAGAAIGKRIRPSIGDGDIPDNRTIVGVVADARYAHGNEAAPLVYVPITQVTFPSLQLAVRSTTGMPDDAAIERALEHADPLLAPPTFETLDAYAAEDLASARLSASLLGTLAFVALVLAVAGIYAVVSFGVAQRTREFGIRMALGARGGAIVRDVLGRAALQAGCGIVLGLMLAGLVARFVASQLVGVRAGDPLIYGIVTALVAASALLAAGVPAVRATRVDPLEALRYE